MGAAVCLNPPHNPPWILLQDVPSAKVQPVPKALPLPRSVPHIQDLSVLVDGKLLLSILMQDVPQGSSSSELTDEALLQLCCGLVPHSAQSYCPHDHSPGVILTVTPPNR